MVPLLGVFLLMPPFVLLFVGPQAVFGIPLIVLYLFGVWGAVVLATWRLARRLVGPPEPPAEATTQPSRSA